MFCAVMDRGNSLGLLIIQSRGTTARHGKPLSIYLPELSSGENLGCISVCGWDAAKACAY